MELIIIASASKKFHLCSKLKIASLISVCLKAFNDLNATFYMEISWKEKRDKEILQNLFLS